MWQQAKRLDVGPVVLPQLAGVADDLWDLLLNLADHVDVPWTLVGGQMVMLHGLQRARPSPRLSADVDAVIDVRAAPKGLPSFVAVLKELRLRPVGAPSPEGVMHRYARPDSGATVDVIAAATSVDVLVPEGLGPKTQAASSDGRAFAAPGTTQALGRTELLPIAYGSRTTWIPRPSLLGSIVLKAVGASEDSRDVTRHQRDLAFLCSLVDDPFALLAACTDKDGRRLRRAAAKLSDDSPVWRALEEGADDGRDTWRILTAM